MNRSHEMKTTFLLVLIVCMMVFPSVILAEELFYTDTKSGLMWKAADNGADISWFEAKAYCEELQSGGFDDWRMPTQDELATLYRLEGAETGDYYVLADIQLSACCQWASDTAGAKVASFDYEYGNRDWGHPRSTVEARVLAVRDI